jgi:hypothetical protein
VKTDAGDNYLDKHRYETPLYLPVIPGSGFHRVMLIRRDKYVSVCIQIFVDKSDPPPIYEVVVGEAAI